METAQKVAQALLKIGAVRFSEELTTFKSGIKSPVYVDNREFPFHPDQWKIVIEGFKDFLQTKNLPYDVIAGVAVGGIPHSSALGYTLGKSSIFIRKQAKEYGLQKLVEGGDVKDKKVILVEDVVSSGASSLNAIKEIRNAGGIVNNCLVIVSYDFPEAKEAFKKENVELHALTSFPVILEEAIKLGKVKDEEVLKLREWFANPHIWDNK